MHRIGGNGWHLFQGNTLGKHELIEKSTTTTNVHIYSIFVREPVPVEQHTQTPAVFAFEAMSRFQRAT